MKLTTSQTKAIMNKMLSKTERWNTTMDDALFDSYILNKTTPADANGLPYVPAKVITLDSSTYILNVEYNPYVLLGNNASMAIVYSSMGILFSPSIIKVFVDDNFTRLDEDVQQAIIWHEIGHIMHTHIGWGAYRDINKEYDADMYAAQVVGVEGVVHMLTLMLSIYKKSVFNHAMRKEIKQRINNVKGGK